MSKIKTWWDNLDWFSSIMIIACAVVFAVCGLVGYGIVGEWWAALLGGSLGLLGLAVIVIIMFWLD